MLDDDGTPVNVRLDVAESQDGALDVDISGAAEREFGFGVLLVLRRLIELGADVSLLARANRTGQLDVPEHAYPVALIPGEDGDLVDLVQLVTAGLIDVRRPRPRWSLRVLLRASGLPDVSPGVVRSILEVPVPAQSCGQRSWVALRLAVGLDPDLHAIGESGARLVVPYLSSHGTRLRADWFPDDNGVEDRSFTAPATRSAFDAVYRRGRRAFWTTYINHDIEQAGVTSVRWEGKRVPRLRAATAEFKSWRFTGCRLDGADLFSTDFEDARIQDCSFRGVTLTASHFYSTEILRTVFNGADLRNSRFVGCDLRDIEFAGCDLEGAVFIGCSFGHVNFTSSDIDTAVFSNATVLEGCAWPGSRPWWPPATRLAATPSPDHSDVDIRGRRRSAAEVSWPPSLRSTLELQRSATAQATGEGGCATIRVDAPRPEHPAHTLRPASQVTFRAFDSDDDMVGAELAGASLDDWSWSNVQSHDSNFKDASFRGASVRETDFSGSNFDGAAFDGANLEGVSFEHANLTQATWSASRLARVRFCRSDLRAADFRGADVSDAEWEHAIYDDRTRWPDAVVPQQHNMIGPRCSIQSCSLDGAKLVGVDMSEAAFTDVSLADCKLDHACLVRANLKRAAMHRVRAVGLDAAGADLSAAQLRDVDLREASLTSAKLRGARMRCVDGRSADLSAADLSGAELHDVDFRGARMRDTNLSGSTLTRVDLRTNDCSGLDLSGASVLDSDLRGVQLPTSLGSIVTASGTRVDFGTYELSQWTVVQLNSWIELGGLVDLPSLPERVRRGLATVGRGLKLTYQMRLHRIDYTALDLLIHQVLGPEADVTIERRSNIRVDGPAFIELVGSRPDELLRVAEAIYDRVWESRTMGVREANIVGVIASGISRIEERLSEQRDHLIRIEESVGILDDSDVQEVLKDNADAQILKKDKKSLQTRFQRLTQGLLREVQRRTLGNFGNVIKGELERAGPPGEGDNQ